MLLAGGVEEGGEVKEALGLTALDVLEVLGTLAT
jgi:hypothetical protein